MRESTTPLLVLHKNSWCTSRTPSCEFPGRPSPCKWTACAVRGPQILNVCQLYDAGPVVLALFVDAGSCADILGDMQAMIAGGRDVRT